MADEQTPQQGEQQQVQLMVDDREMETIYMNGYHIKTTVEEVAVDVGFNMPDPSAPQGQPRFLFKVSGRVIMNYGNAKRLAMSLTQLVKRYEQQFGELPLQPGPKK